MVSKNRVLSVIAATTVVALAAAAIPCSEAAGNNVRVTFTLGKIESKKNKTPIKSFSVVVTSGGQSASLLTGARVPIPMTATTSDVVSYTYQNVGFSAEIEALILQGGNVDMRANVEDSWVDPETADAQPVVETRHQRVGVILQDGVPLEIARSTDGNRVRYVEVMAEILD